MKSILKKSNITPKIKFFSILAFFILSLMVTFSFDISSASAANTNGGKCTGFLSDSTVSDDNKNKFPEFDSSYAASLGDGAGSYTSQFTDIKGATSEADCLEKCNQDSNAKKDNWQCGWKSDEQQKAEDKKQVEAFNNTINKKSTCDGVSITDPWTIVNCLLLYILKFVGFLLNLAIIIFRKMIDTDALKLVMSNDTVYQVWQIVRDMLNILFIMTLLFSAFATVFQIEKYNYRKVLLNLVLMALLVNFSYPITRFIIDVSNVIMYFFVNTLLNGGNTTGEGAILKFSGLNGIIGAAKVGDSTLYLMAAIVFFFMLAITILIIGVLLLIRVVALTILIIFSPIGYIGTIIPGSELAKAAHTWWSSLMNYSFFGPIMVFLIYVAIKMMEALQGFNFDSGQLSSNSMVSEFASKAALCIIPIIILWMGILSAKKSSTWGSNAVINTGMKWGGGFAKSPYKGAGWLSNKYGLTGAWKERVNKFNKSGYFGSDRQTEREAELGTVVAGLWGNKNAVRDLERKKVSDIRKGWKDNGGASNEDIQKALQGSSAQKKAAALEAAEKNGFKDVPGGPTALTQYKQALEAVKTDPVYDQLFNSKIKEKHIRFVIEQEIADGKNADAAYKDNLKGMTAQALAKQQGLHENIGTNGNFENYITKEVKNDTDYHKELFKNLTRDQRKEYHAKGLSI